MTDDERGIVALCHELSIKVVEDKSQTASVLERGRCVGADPSLTRGRGAINFWGSTALCEVVKETMKERRGLRGLFLPILVFIVLPVLLKSNAFYFHRPEFQTFCEF